LIRTIFPTGLSEPKRFSATVVPSRQTFTAASISCGVKYLPSRVFHSRISKYSGETPWRIVLQFWFP
jgi:hypothetical protein